MNPFKVQEMVEKAVRNRELDGSKTYVLTFIDGEIKCIPKKQIKMNYIQFAHYTHDYLNRGFTSTDWNHLADIIGKYLEHRKEDAANEPTFNNIDT